MKIGKRESQRLEKRAQIIAEPRQHFFEHGFDNTTMSAIAAQLSGSKRRLWSRRPTMLFLRADARDPDALVSGDQFVEAVE